MFHARVVRPGVTRLHRVGLMAIVAFYLASTLAIAVRAPRGMGFYDEKFNLEIVRGFLDGSASAPANHWYSPLSWAPQLAVLKLANWAAAEGGLDWLAIYDAPHGRANALFVAICRSINALYATGALLLVYALARQLASPAAGLWAAVAFAGSPWAIRGAVEFKPDPLLLLTTLLCVAASLRLLTDDGWRRFAAVGVAAGLTASAKLNGVLVGPTVALAIAAGGLSGRRLARTAVASLLALATFGLTQPWLLSALPFWRRIRAHYENKPGRLSFAEMIAHPWAKLLDGMWLGPLVGGIALVALAALAIGVVRHWRTSSAARAWGVLLSYPLFYVLGTALLTRYPKNNLWMQLLPFAAIAFGWGVAGAGERLGTARRYPDGSRSPAARLTGAVLGGALAAAALGPGASYAYRLAVPATEGKLLQQARRLVGPQGVLAAVGPEGAWMPTAIGARQLRRTGEPGGWARVASPVMHFDKFTVAADGSIPELETFDGWMFAPGRLGADQRRELDRHLRSLPAGARVRRIQPSWYAARGEAWILVARPWATFGAGDCRSVGPPGTEIDRPSVTEGEVAATVQVKLASAAAEDPPELLVAGRRLPLLDMGREGDGRESMRLLTSPRFFWPEGPVRLAGGLPAGAEVCTQAWRRPEAR